MKTTMLTTAGLLLAGSLFVGCASAPTQELETAQAALTGAEEVEADRYVADLYQAAQDSLAAAQAEIELQNGEFALSRNYDRAERLLTFVTETAQTASTQVEERKMVMQVETEGFIAQTQQALTQAQTLMASAPRGKEGRMALVSISEDTSTAQTMLNDAIMSLESGDVATAHTQAQAALDKANGLVQELETAISKTRS